MQGKPKRNKGNVEKGFEAYWKKRKLMRSGALGATDLAMSVKNPASSTRSLKAR